MLKFLSNVFLGNYNEKEIKRLRRRLEAVNAREGETAALDDGALRAKTGEFRGRLERGETTDELLPEAFAVAREAARRTLQMRHFDVQVIGGLVLHEGRVAEMATGEGKTLVATLPAYLNALTGKGVHVVTVNDYLASRDSEWMGRIYAYLGLSVGLNVHGLDYPQKVEAYAADITYGTNNEFGFDYLRDNMVLRPEEMVQRNLHYAIIDEVDSILIDEARTPLIISGPGERSSAFYQSFARIVPRLVAEKDFTVDEKNHAVAPTEEGVAKVEKMIGVKNLYANRAQDLSHYLLQSLKAHVLMKRDRDYVVKDNQVIIVDEFTGRLMFGRRYSDGLHQAIEAKEGVKVEEESQTLATITFQNYFRMYEKLAGMTGTAVTEEEEFRKIYGMDTLVIPTNKPLIRKYEPDAGDITETANFSSAEGDIVECDRRGQPGLVGTISIEKSERLSRMLSQRGVTHEVLNAKYHEREAQIVSRAGQKGAVTIATNMAGRGTDIVLGDGVADLGGLRIIGTERHESRRIDNQLRGRAGRQGDPGVSRFYLSLEDDLMRIFGGDNVKGLMDRFGLEEDQPLESGLLTRTIEGSQRKVENRNFDLRKHVLEYDDVINTQREIIYAERRRVLREENLRDQVMDMVGQLIGDLVASHCPDKVHPEEWDIDGLLRGMEAHFLHPGRVEASRLAGKTREEIEELLLGIAEELYAEREKTLGPEMMRELERVLLLRTVDSKWIEHLDGMDELRDGIGLRAYGQRDPLVEYKREAYDMFQELVQAIRNDVSRLIYQVDVVVEQPEAPRQVFENLGGEVSPAIPARATPTVKVGRNDPCPCGSGVKYKKCHGREAG